METAAAKTAATDSGESFPERRLEIDVNAICSPTEKMINEISFPAICSALP